MAEETFQGTVASVEDGTYGPVVKVSTGGPNLRTVYVGERYEGEKPVVGAYAAFSIWRSEPKPGRKYGSAYLNAYQPMNAPQNGSGGSSGGSTSGVDYPERASKKEAGLLLKTAVNSLDPGASMEVIFNRAKELRIVLGSLISVCLGADPKEE